MLSNIDVDCCIERSDIRKIHNYFVIQQNL
jgi:hypothetical protein